MNFLNKKMIEVTWNNVSDDVLTQHLLKFTELMSWLLTSIMNDIELHNIEIRGYVIIHDKDKLCMLIMTDAASGQQEILKLLQEPPEEYKEQYSTCILSEEPHPVQEKVEDDKDEQNEEAAQAAADI